MNKDLARKSSLLRRTIAALPSLLFGFVAGSATAAPDVSGCMAIMSEEVINKTTTFTLDDNRKLSQSQVCSSLNESKAKGIGFEYKFIGLSANDSNAKAESICSSSSSAADDKYVQKLFSQEIGNNQLAAFSRCLDALSTPSDLVISSFIVKANNGDGIAGSLKATPYWGFSVTFKWIPSSAQLTETVFYVAKTEDEYIGDCDMTLATPAITPYPGWPEQWKVSPNTEYTYACDVVRRVKEPIITLGLKDGSSKQLQFPAQ